MEQDLQQTLLEQLRDIHLPAEVSWWPLAPGWWILLFLFLAAAIFAIWAMIKHRNNNRYRRVAALELDLALVQWQQSQDPAAFIQATNVILKRTVAAGLATNSSEAVLSLTGERWTDLLNQYSEDSLSNSSAQALARAGYEPSPEVDVPKLHAEAKNWILNHRHSPAKSQTQGEKVHA